MSENVMYGEVGTPANRFSPIGIQSRSINPIVVNNRVVILEPKNTGGYPNVNDWYENICILSKCLVFRGNIFFPDSLKSVPQLDLIALENVLNDPCSSFIKDWSGLFQFLNVHVKPGGVVFIIDSITHYCRLEKKYGEFVKHINGFKVIVDEVFGEKTDHKNSLRTIEKMIEVDDALRNGFNHLDDYGLWYILQKTD